MGKIAELRERIVAAAEPRKQRELLKSFLLLYPTALSNARNGRQYFRDGTEPMDACYLAEAAIKLEAGNTKHAKLAIVLKLLSLYSEYEIEQNSVQ